MMDSNTLKLVIAEVHLVVGLAAVSALTATGHLTPEVATGFLGGLLGVGTGGALVLVNPTASPQAQAPTKAAAAAPAAPAAAPAPPPQTAPPAQTPAAITGLAAAPAMPGA